MIRGLRAAADLILPRVCLVCGRKLLLGEKHICLYCQSDIPYTRFRQLEHNPMADRFNEAIQRHLDSCQGPSREVYAYALSLFFYDTYSDYRHIPYHIKYHGDISAGRHFGQMLGLEVAQAPYLNDIDVIIPVPLHWRRKWSRGYNQAEVLARAVSEVTGVPVRTDILKRRRHTGTQTRLGLEEKKANVKGAFRVNGTALSRLPIHPGHILIIDDVFTTGSTLMACFSALREVFPPSVRISVATLAFVGGH